MIVLLRPHQRRRGPRHARLANGPTSRLIVPLSPLVESLTRVAGAVLSALGKSLDHAPMGRRQADEAGLMHDWLDGNG